LSLIVTQKGRRTGVEDMGLGRKVKVLQKTLERNRLDPKDAVDVLSKVGGFEIGGIAGVILAGARYRTLVVLDGFISGATALLAASLSSQVKPFLIASRQSVEESLRII
jgi:nicotinate-nucleotide--dimethylbenzimidazole phosphoribosyltransferase